MDFRNQDKTLTNKELNICKNLWDKYNKIKNKLNIMKTTNKR